jgi:hypothetical protein
MITSLVPMNGWIDVKAYYRHVETGCIVPEVSLAKRISITLNI